MAPQRTTLPVILSEERLCVFDAVGQSEDFTSFLSRRDVNDYLETPLGAIVLELTALAAVEFALVRLVYMTEQPMGNVPLPLPISPQDARLALVRYDTTDTKPCETAERILAGNIRPQDLFLFTGDLQKYQILAEPDYESLEEGLESLPSLVAARLNISATLLAKDLLEGMWAEFQQLVWRLRLLVMLEVKEDISKEDKIKKAIRSFRGRWDPFSNPMPTYGGRPLPEPIG